MSLILTRSQNWRVKAPQFDKNMTRIGEYGALDFFVQQTDSGRSFVTPELKDAAMRSVGTTLQIPVIDYDGDVTVANVRTCTVADNENTSRLYTVVFATYAVGFTMVPSLFMNNDISYDHDFNRKMEKVLRAMADSMDKAAVATLEANKTRVFKNPLTYGAPNDQPPVGDVLNAPWDSRQEIVGDLKPIFRANDYGRNIMHIIGNSGVDSVLGKSMEYGEYNEVNKQRQWNDKVVHFTENIVNEAGDFATGFAVEDGNVGYLTRSGRENILGTKALGHEFDIVNMPILNMPVDTHYYEAIGDQSAIAGEASADMNCNLKQYFSFAVDIAFLVSYNSDPEEIANPIAKFKIERNDTPNAYARPVRIVNNEDNPVFTQTVA